MSDPTKWQEELDQGDREAYQSVCWELDTVRWMMVDTNGLSDDALMAFDLAVAAFKEKHKALED